MATEETLLEDITSLASVPITNCNVPDPRSVEAEFVYNFYVDGEDVSYTPQPTSPISYESGLVDRKTIDEIEQKERGSLSARVPRYMRLKIAPFLDGIEPLTEGEISNEFFETLRTPVGRTKAYSLESDVENRYGAKIMAVDAGARRRVQSELYRIASALIEAQSPNSEYSDQMIATTLNNLLSDDVDAAIMMDALSDNQIKGYRFVNQITGKNYSRFDLKESIRVLSKVNADGYRSVTTQQVVSNPFSNNFLSDLLGSAADSSEKNWVLDKSIFGTFTGFNDASLGSLQPILSAPEVSNERIAESRDAIVSLGYPIIKHAGYIIEKIGTSPSGIQERFDDIVALNPTVTEFIDPLVKYGYTYTYRARQLFIVKIIAENPGDEDTGSYRYNIVTAAIASSSPAPATIRAIETTPPNPPGTLVCSFIYKTGNGIRLDWSRPSNPTRDIRKYQIFRRKGILEPFQLIAEYDFTDPAYTQFDQREVVNPSLITRSPIPVYSHVDREFSRESSYIYAVASVDAHGLTSGYGTQILATFDRFSNTLNTSIISRSGAPKPYPNYYVDPTKLEEFGSDRLVEDVIKDSGHGKMRIYFNPDAYRIASDDDGTQNDPIVLSTERGTYRFQVINLDRQVSKVLTVDISKDRSLGDVL